LVRKKTATKRKNVKESNESRIKTIQLHPGVSRNLPKPETGTLDR
jgi:hypothetical protein